MNYREKMREYLKEPNKICNHYGKWGILNKEQRDLITRLLNEMDGADNYIKKMQQENEQLKEVIKEVREYIEKYRYITDKVTDEDSLYYGQDITMYAFNDDNVMELLQILDKVKD